MNDIVEPEVRSRMMSRIRGANTRPEMLIRSALHRRGLRYRLHRRDLPGRPDLVFPASSAVLFIHGCFWHRHPGCAKATTPMNNGEFWRSKFEANVARDRRQIAELHKTGWRVRVIWECEIGTMPSTELLEDLETFVRSGAGSSPIPA
jgi:DNA mismatch endonuclease (patch repair protein)